MAVPIIAGGSSAGDVPRRVASIYVPRPKINSNPPVAQHPKRFGMIAAGVVITVAVGAFALFYPKAELDNSNSLIASANTIQISAPVHDSIARQNELGNLMRKYGLTNDEMKVICAIVDSIKFLDPPEFRGRPPTNDMVLRTVFGNPDLMNLGTDVISRIFSASVAYHKKDGNAAKADKMERIKRIAILFSDMSDESFRYKVSHDRRFSKD